MANYLLKEFPGEMLLNQNLFRRKRKRSCDFSQLLDFQGASGWAWIQEDEIVRNLWKLQETKIQIVTELRQKVFKS